jgi:selenocysteine lyase/cysteine desulfurase
VRRPLLDALANEGHYFNTAAPRKRLVPAGPDHAQVAAARGIAEYFDALDAHHGGGDTAARPQRVRELLRKAELALLPRLLDFLSADPRVRLLGPADAAQRAATVAFAPLQRTPAEVAASLAKQGIMAASGHFYSVRLLEALGLNPERGVLRLSFVHYTTPAEMTQLLKALDTTLSARGQDR